MFRYSFSIFDLLGFDLFGENRFFDLLCEKTPSHDLIGKSQIRISRTTKTRRAQRNSATRGQTPCCEFLCALRVFVVPHNFPEISGARAKTP
jgi:hypothetical protein